ncbi:hypothetical protein QQ020_09620 [Fulvivirgaceae bacterium BMA12]|uniref:Lipoprotein n=1 Tax=Agaribacillus aureus TaxID=3051825 RepID=A0ABT8L3M0_9BACT|nr:hypothetical protein [Fulvivirgaceae bacterium BMA12]
MGYKISISLLIVFILFAFTIACEKDHTNTEKSGTTELETGESRNMEHQKQVKLKGTPIHISFDELVHDFRCPTDVTCVHAGLAEVAMIIKKQDLTTTLHLTLEAGQPGKASAVFENYKFTLLEVLPLPNSQVTIPQEDYRIVLRADKI